MSTEQLATTTPLYTSDSWLANTQQPSLIKDEHLLALFADQLAHLAKYNWYRTERHAIDQHALSQLAQAKSVVISERALLAIEEKLSQFISTDIQPLWDELDFMSHDEKHQQALNLVSALSLQVFGDSKHESEASWILYFALPQLPFFAMDDAIIKAMKSSDGSAVVIESYAQFHQCCRRRLSRLMPYIHESALAPSEEVTLRTASTNWWQRNCLLNFLRSK